MKSQDSGSNCHNPQCQYGRRFWFKRWRQPRGIWLNKNWYCSLDCFEQGAVSNFSGLSFQGEPNKSVRYRFPLGLLMLSKGFLSSQSIQEALKAQRELQRGRIGEWLRELGVVTEEQLTTALGMQWGCPVFHLAQSPGFNECAHMIPFRIMEASRMVPVHFMPTSRSLYIAFADGVDFCTMRGIEQMLDCSTRPCVISESEMSAALETISQVDRPEETVLDFPGNFQQLAREVREWAEANQAEQVKAVACPGCLWVRLEGSAAAGNLLFPFEDSQAPLKPSSQAL